MPNSFSSFCGAAFLFLSVMPSWAMAKTVITTTPPAESSSSAVLSKEQIQGVIGKNLSGVRACYTSMLENNPQAQGKMTLEWFVVKNGAVEKLKVVSSTIDDGDFRKCMIETVKAWKFPKHKAKEPVKVVYPFVFAPL